jgi:tRNA A-37 threonylcarbamoyl transferase component Bud32
LVEKSGTDSAVDCAQAKTPSGEAIPAAPYEDAQYKGCEFTLSFASLDNLNPQLAQVLSDTQSLQLSGGTSQTVWEQAYWLNVNIVPSKLWYFDTDKQDSDSMVYDVVMPGEVTDYTQPNDPDVSTRREAVNHISWQFTIRASEKADESGRRNPEFKTYLLSARSKRAVVSGVGMVLIGAVSLAIIGGLAGLAFVLYRFSMSQRAPTRPRSAPQAVPESRAARALAAASPSTSVRPGQLPGDYPMVGQSLGQYVIRELIGRGGMAAVYRARHSILGRNVALKVLAPHLTQEPEFVRRFNREGRVLAELAHPNIVTVYDAGVDRGYYYLAMEFVQGESLDKRLQRKKMLSPREVIWVGQCVTRALTYAHGRGLIHRDIKPANLLLGQDGNLKVADFGIAMLVSQGASATLVAGTPGYMPPEQAQGITDARSDIYSMGALLYHLITGCLPVARPGETFKPPEQINPSTPPSLSYIIMRALQADPAQRFQSANEMQQALDRCAER